MARRASPKQSAAETSSLPAEVGDNPETASEAPAHVEDPAEEAAVPRVLINEPGMYDGIPERDYHADPCPEPSLSRSVAKLLVDLSPRHAYVAHPRLGATPDLASDSDDEVADFGTAAHSSFLQNKSTIVCLDFPTWATNKSKDARRQAYADGMIPLLTKSYGRAMRLIDELERFRARTGAFTQGRGEQTCVWQEENGIWCRARVDWLPDNPEAALWDLKTTNGRATLAAWTRVCFDKGADLQDSFYTRGVEMVRGEPPGDMKFCVIEQKPPYAIGVFTMSPQAREAAVDDVRLAIRRWGECLAATEWPSYPIEEQWVWPPAWITRGREERMVERKRLEQVAFSREHPNAVQYVETGNFGG
jgi:hypothetical protein